MSAAALERYVRKNGRAALTQEEKLLTAKTPPGPDGMEAGNIRV